ncbi:MAG: MFS transporter [Alphaproteobacteria bacterium]|nr:MFS transporter [Alphaproteobacteria bacterium]
MSLFTGLRLIPQTLGQPNYGLYVAGNSLSLIGSWMQRVAVGWLAWELSHSGTVLGLVAFADLAPTMMIGPFGGALADRFDRRRLLTIGQSINMVLSFVLAALTASGMITVPLLVLIIGLNGAVIGINQPARLSLISSLVPRDHLPTAVAINSLVFNLARFIGPAIAGLVILRFGTAPVFLLNALSFISFLIALSRLDLPKADHQSVGGDGPPPMLQAIAEGLRYVLAHRGIGPLLALNATLAVSARPYVELLPGFAGAVFDRGAGGLAMLSSAVGLGAIAAGLFLAQRGPRKGLAETAMLAGLLVAFSALGLALSPTFSAAVIAATSGGFGMVIAGVGTQTLMQTSVDEAMRGRVLSLFGLVFRSGPAIGALLMGLASDVVGLRWPLALGSLIGACAFAYVWRRRGKISNALKSEAA